MGALQKTLQGNAHFVSSESGTERDNRGVHNNGKTLFWSLSQGATEAIFQGYNFDPHNIDFSKVKIPFLLPAKKSEIQQLIEDLKSVGSHSFWLIRKLFRI